MKAEGLLWIVGFIIIFAIGIWATAFAPCSFFGWFSVESIPGRCLTIVKD